MPMSGMKKMKMVLMFFGGMWDVSRSVELTCLHVDSPKLEAHGDHGKVTEVNEGQGKDQSPVVVGTTDVGSVERIVSTQTIQLKEAERGMLTSDPRRDAGIRQRSTWSEMPLPHYIS